MLKLVTREDAEQLFKDIPFRGDPYVTPADEAVRTGRMIPAAGKWYVLTQTEESGIKWHTDAVIRFSNDFMKANGLEHEFRHIEHVISPSKGCRRATERVTDFDLPAESRKPPGNMTAGKGTVKGPEDKKKGDSAK